MIATKILKHLGLPTQIDRCKPHDVWQVRGPHSVLVPEDLDEAPSDQPGVPPDADFGMPFWDDLPADDVAA